ncbi:hypothetical protein ACSBR1_016778 [Camellia fascicularis]
MMAAAEARAAWQRTANRCFVQEDAKRAPKLACCPSASSSSKQVDAGPANTADGHDNPNVGFMPLNRNTSYSNLPPESRWWLQLQPNYGLQTTLTNEQLNTLEGEMETFQAGVLKSTVKPSEVHDGSHIDDHSEPSLKSAQEPLKPDNMGEYYELLDIDPVGCSVSKQPNELGFDSYSPWIGGEKTEPWWRMADRGELASLVAQRSLDLIENCDLPRPQSKHVKREDPYAYLGNFDRDGILPSSKDFKVQTGNALSNRTVRSACGKQWTLSEEQPQYGLDKQNSDGPAHNGMTEAQFSDTDSSKAQLLEALCHSQTRAREAEKAAKQAYAEKEHVLKLFFKQASHLFAYKQWLQLLEFENLFFQIKNNNQPTSTLFPVVLPWMMPNKSWKLPKRCQKPAKGKRGKRGRPRCGISKFAVAFTVSLSLVGVGLILGWTVGWMLPTF